MKSTDETYFVPHCDNESCSLGTFEFDCPNCGKHNVDYENFYSEELDQFDHECEHCKLQLLTKYTVDTSWMTYSLN